MDYFLTVLLYSKVTVKSRKIKPRKIWPVKEKRKQKEAALVEHTFQGGEHFQEGGGKETDRFKKKKRGFKGHTSYFGLLGKCVKRS